MNGAHDRLQVQRTGIDTYQQPVVYMHHDCDACQGRGDPDLLWQLEETH